MFQAFSLLKVKYRFSIMDIWPIQNNKVVTILLSRLCKEKSEVYEQMLYVMHANGIDLSRSIGRPNFSPNIEEYRFSQTGIR